MYYFAYGSNMASQRLRRRLPSAEPIGPARLDGYRRTFNVYSTRDGSAKCNAVPDAVGPGLFGVVFRIDPAERLLLDRFEGTGVEYRAVRVRVVLLCGRAEDALTYLGTRIDVSRLPFHWYKEHVLRGALEHNLPDEQIAQIRAVASLADPDSVRAAAELGIYL